MMPRTPPPARPRVVLASTSRYRRALLDGLGVHYEAHTPPFVEDHGAPLTPPQMAIAFARGKADSLGPTHGDALIIGSDQVPADETGRILTKPGDRARAIDQLLALAGRRHYLYTAVALHDARRGVTRERLITHEMTMRPLTRALAEAYVALDEPYDCAGSYRVEARGVLLFESMVGPDHTAIVGLPLAATAALLREAGVDWLSELAPAAG